MEVPYFCEVALFIMLIKSSFLISIHSHSHIRERIEDGGYSPKSNDVLKKSETELIHEVIVGSVKEAKKFDHLSPEESKERLLLLLLKMDINNDKYVDPEELHSWIVKSFKKLSDEEAEERFNDADLNKDDKITWKEQLLDSFGEESEFDDFNIEEESFIKADERLFHAADSNNDGILNKTEYKRFCNPEDFTEMIPILIQNILEEKDRNRDGFIDFEEFINGDDRLKDEAWVTSEKEVFVSNYDKNKDGLLNQEEILSWIVPNSSRVAAEETKHLMVAVDDNHDLLLSFEEILRNHDVFVGSEATDFGEHLQNIHSIIDEL